MPQTGSIVVVVAIASSSWFWGVRVFEVSVTVPRWTCGVRCAGGAAGSGAGCQRRNRLALVTTDSDDRAIAAAAMIGDRWMPKNGYNSPAAIGMPTAL